MSTDTSRTPTPGSLDVNPPPIRSSDAMEAVYGDLRRLAAWKIANERPGQTLTATALVHEAYLRVANRDEGPRWQNRAHFYKAAATAMRRILIDRARRKRAARHGGGVAPDPLDTSLAPPVDEPPDTVLALNDALTRLG